MEDPPIRPMGGPQLTIFGAIDFTPLKEALRCAVEYCRAFAGAARTSNTTDEAWETALCEF